MIRPRTCFPSSLLPGFSRYDLPEWPEASGTVRKTELSPGAVLSGSCSQQEWNVLGTVLDPKPAETEVSKLEFMRVDSPTVPHKEKDYRTIDAIN